MSRPSSPVRALRGRLGRLRHRIRFLLTVQGLARWLVAAVAAGVLFFAADWLLDLPLGVRRFMRFGLLDRPDGLAFVSWICLLIAAAGLTLFSSRRRLGAAPVFAFAFGGIAGVLVWMGLRVFRPLSQRLPDEDLALAVEQRYERLNDRLAAALDFEEELASPTRGESEAMMRVVLDEAAREAKGLAFARAASAARTLSWFGAAAAAIALALGIGLLAPDTVGLWARRSLLLEDARWPQATTIVAVDIDEETGAVVERDPATPYEVAVGRPLLVRAEARGKVPDEVVLLDRVEGARPLPRRMSPVPDREGLFLIEVRDVRRSFAFVLQGGDDTDDEPLYQVVVTVPPRVLDLNARLEYPAYLEREAEDLAGGNVSVPEGTQVTISITTDVPVAEAWALLGDERMPTAPTVEDGRHYAFSFEAMASQRYRLLLRTETGRESDPAADTYEVVVVPDRAPRVTWLYPRATLDTTPTGRVPLLVLTNDDHAVTDLVLETRTADGHVRAFPLVERDADGAAAAAPDGSLAANDGAYGRTEVRTYLPLDVADLRDEADSAPIAPARVAARVVARDSRGQKKEGPWAAIDVYGPVDMERALASRRSSVRSELAAVLAEQKNRREQMAGLVDIPLESAEKDLLKSIQFSQAKIAQDTDQAVQGLLDIFNGWVYDRLAAQGPTERILALLDRWHRRTYGRAEESEGTADAAALAGDAVFPYAVYDEIVEAWKARRIFDTGLLDRMLVVLSRSVEAASRKAPAAHRAAADAAAGKADVKEALVAQDALIESLDGVLDAMRNWQSLNDLILMLRRILEEQEALNARLESDKENG